MSKSNYSESVKKLRVFLKQKEADRQNWAGEKWSHANGRIFQIGRVLVPVLMVIGCLLMGLVCMIRFANIPEINQALSASKAGTNSYMKDDATIYPFFILVFIAICFCVYTVINFIKGQYKKTPYYLLGTSAFLTFCSVLRYLADQGTFPDNSDHELGPQFTYYEYCLFTLVVFAVLTIYALILVILTIRDNKEFEKSVEHTLLKIVPKNETGNLLTEDDYAKLIDAYIEKNSKTVYVEPADYIPKKLRKKYKLGEYAEDDK